MTNVRMTMLDCGRITLPRKEIYFGEGEAPVTVPVPAFLIEHPDGPLLFEGGMQPDVAVSLAGLPGYELDVGPEHHVTAQLAAAGVDPKDVRYALSSHLHWDHVGAIGHLPDTEFLVHRADWEYAHAPDWFATFAYPLEHIDRVSRWTFVETTEEAPEHDVFGDGSVVSIFVPGHSPGLQSLVVRLEDETVLLTSDAVVSESHWERRALPFYLDAPAVVRSVERLHRVVETHGVDRVIFGHDLAQFEALQAASAA